MGWGAGLGMGKALQGVGQSMQEDLRQQRIQDWKAEQAAISRQFESDTLDKRIAADDARSLAEREARATENDLNRKSAEKVAGIRASGRSGDGTRLNPYIKAQIEGIDNKLKALYEGGGDANEIAKLEQQRTFLLGGGLGTGAPASDPDKGESNPNKGNDNAASDGPGILDFIADTGKNAINSASTSLGEWGERNGVSTWGEAAGLLMPSSRDLQNKKDSVMAIIKHGNTPNPKDVQAIWEHLTDAEKQQINNAMGGNA